MDVLYVIGGGSKFDNAELRYSLRSIEKNGIGLGNVIIVGMCPDWINKKSLNWIPCGEPINGTPAKNVYTKIRVAFSMRRELVPDRFLLSSDDHFFIRPTDFENYPIHYKALHMPTLSDAGKVGDTRYTEVMVNTHKVMKWFGLDCKFYEGHTNKLYDRQTWNHLDDLGVWDMMNQFQVGFSTNSLMAAAFMQSHPDYPCILRKDIKIGSFKDRMDLITQIGESNSFSIRDAAIRSGVIEYLNEQFPHKSKYEL